MSLLILLPERAGGVSNEFVGIRLSSEVEQFAPVVQGYSQETINSQYSHFHNTKQQKPQKVLQTVHNDKQLGSQLTQNKTIESL